MKGHLKEEVNSFIFQNCSLMGNIHWISSTVVGQAVAADISHAFPFYLLGVLLCVVSEINISSDAKLEGFSYSLHLLSLHTILYK